MTSTRKDDTKGRALIPLLALAMFVSVAAAVSVSAFTETVTYSYDSTYQVITSIYTAQAATVAYGYDDAGNRT